MVGRDACMTEYCICEIGGAGKFAWQRELYLWPNVREGADGLDEVGLFMYVIYKGICVGPDDRPGVGDSFLFPLYLVFGLLLWSIDGSGTSVSDNKFVLVLRVASSSMRLRLWLSVETSLTSVGGHMQVCSTCRLPCHQGCLSAPTMPAPGASIPSGSVPGDDVLGFVVTRRCGGEGAGIDCVSSYPLCK
jgi:hypothetical protein